MTREERKQAISEFNNFKKHSYNHGYLPSSWSIEMAIEALEPCEDAISREYLFKVLDDFCGHERTATITLDTLADLVYDMPIVKPQEPFDIDQYCKEHFVVMVDKDLWEKAEKALKQESLFEECKKYAENEETE